MVVRNFHPFENKFVPVIYFVLWGPPNKLVKQQMLACFLKAEKETIIFRAKKLNLFFSRQKNLSWTTTKWCCFSTQCWFDQRIEREHKNTKNKQTKKQWLKEYKINQRFLFVHRSETQTPIWIRFSNETQTRALVFWFCCRLKPKIFWLSFWIKIFENKKRKFLHVLDFSKIQTET